MSCKVSDQYVFVLLTRKNVKVKIEQLDFNRSKFTRKNKRHFAADRLKKNSTHLYSNSVYRNKRKWQQDTRVGHCVLFRSECSVIFFF